jgi:serine/threonine-protein kinase
MPPDLKRLFLDELRDSGLLKPAQLDELARLPEARQPDPRALARQVWQRGWLTRFQLAQIAQGHAKALHIGPYVLLEKLGEGGMGQVFKAQHQHMSRVVALKVIRKDRLSHPKAVSRFYQEVQAAGQLHHPNIVLAYDAGEAGGTHFLSMEYVDGRDLDRVIEESGPLPVAQACDYVRQAALGLQHAHERGLVHRDIKPHNLLVTAAPTSNQAGEARGGAWGTVKVLDMGLARWRQGLADQQRGLTRDGAVLGTADFMAPEQARSAHTADSRSDLYSLGCTFFYLLTGRTPFYAGSLTQLLLKHQMEDATPLESLRPDVPAGVLEVVRALLAKNPEDRIPTAAAVAAALEPFCHPDGAAPAPQPVAAAPDNTWASLLGGDEPAPARTRSDSADKTLAGSGGETAAPGPKGGPRRSRKAARPGVPGGLVGLAVALAGAGALGVALLAGGAAVVWMRSGRTRPPAPPHTPPAPLVEAAGGGEVQPAPRPAPAPDPDPVPPAPAPAPAAPPAVEKPLPEVVVKPPPAPEVKPPPAPEVKPPAPAVKKAPAPDAKEQAAAEALIRKEFKADYARKPAERGPLVQTLLDKAEATKDDPAGRFVLLREARALAEQAGDARAALQAIDRLDRFYEVDALDLKLKALAAAAQRATTPAANRALAESALAVLDDLVTAEAYEPAHRLIPLAEAAARKAQQAAFFSQVDARLKEAKDAEKDYEAAQPARATLKDKPDDPDANLVLGKYLCLRKGDWDAGLPLLARGGDKALRDLAAADLARPAAAEAQAQVGDGWWKLAEDPKVPGRTQLQRRACTWYRQALPGLSGFRQDRVADRLKEVQDQAPDARSPETPGELRRLEGHTAKVTGLAFLPDGSRVVSAAYDKTVRLWEPASGKEVRRFTAPGEIAALAVSSDGKQILAGGLSPQVQIWNVDGSGGPGLGQPPGTTVASVAFAPDAGRAVIGNSAGGVLLWDKSGAVQTLPVPKWGTPFAIATSADGRHALFGCADGLAHLWDLDAKREEGQLAGHAGAVLGVALARDGRHALTGGADGTARLWDTATGKAVQRFRGHVGRVLSVALSADGHFALTGGEDRTVRLWDTRSGAEVRRFTGHAGPVNAVAFSPDGRQAVSGGEDKTVRLWELAKPAAAP